LWGKLTWMIDVISREIVGVGLMKSRTRLDLRSNGDWSNDSNKLFASTCFSPDDERHSRLGNLTSISYASMMQHSWVKTYVVLHAPPYTVCIPGIRSSSSIGGSQGAIPSGKSKSRCPFIEICVGTNASVVIWPTPQPSPVYAPLDGWRVVDGSTRLSYAPVRRRFKRTRQQINACVIRKRVSRRSKYSV
jgi:hypothetical protein